MAVSLEDYLKNSKTIQAARKKTTAAKAALATAERAKQGLPAGASATLRSEIDRRIADAQMALQESQNSLTREETAKTSYYNTNVNVIQAKADAKQSGVDRDRLSEANAMRQRLIDAGQPTGTIDSSIKDLNDKINKVGKYAPKSNGTTGSTNTASTTGADGTVEYRDYAKELSTVGQAVAKMDESQRLALSQGLKAAGYKVPVSGLYNDNLINAYAQALAENQGRSINFQREIPFEEFLGTKKIEFSQTGGGLGGGDPDDYVTIASPSVAKNVINQVYQSELQRDATKEELDRLIPNLIKAQKANPNKVKIVNGVRQTTSGLDAEQWIIDRVQKLPEFAQREKDKTIPDIEELQTTARNNGLTLLPSQIESYRLRLKNGEKLDTIKSNIRAIAANAMPDNVKKLMDAGNDLTEVYQPYRQSMAAILEIPFDKIDLNDPTLTNAITDKGNMTIFDFKKSLRKDPRWQYTDNAREVVSSGLTQVLKDFGFMG
jgi:hypothetical protein